MGHDAACGMVWDMYLLCVFLQGSSDFELGSLIRISLVEFQHRLWCHCLGRKITSLLVRCW